jgi:hypothetical protein
MNLKQHIDDVLQYLRQEETGERFRRHTPREIKTIRNKIIAAEQCIEKAVKLIGEAELLTTKD